MKNLKITQILVILSSIVFIDCNLIPNPLEVDVDSKGGISIGSEEGYKNTFRVSYGVLTEDIRYDFEQGIPYWEIPVELFEKDSSVVHVSIGTKYSKQLTFSKDFQHHNGLVVIFDTGDELDGKEYKIVVQRVKKEEK